MSLSNVKICIKKAEFSDFKSEKWIQMSDSIQILSSLLNAYNPIDFDRNMYQWK